MTQSYTGEVRVRVHDKPEKAYHLVFVKAKEHI